MVRDRDQTNTLDPLMGVLRDISQKCGQYISQGCLHSWMLWQFCSCDVDSWCHLEDFLPCVHYTPEISNCFLGQPWSSIESVHLLWELCVCCRHVRQSGLQPNTVVCWPVSQGCYLQEHQISTWPPPIQWRWVELDSFAWWSHPLITASSCCPLYCKDIQILDYQAIWHSSHS